ncbi:MAG TPA: alpha/beta hydrolase [Bryobacteraceae bacterium]|nr:alpha/beta hydrolase [Bryobacteraceae bacterium]
MKDKDTIVFVHGAFATPLCWRFFAPLLADRGYNTLTPAWPCKGRPPDEQVAHPDPRLARVGIDEIVAHYAAIIRAQPKPPVLIGHSFGGLIVQKLLAQGLGAAGIAISSVPPRGVSPVSFSLKPLKRVWQIVVAPSRWQPILSPPPPDGAETALRKAQGIEMHLVPESQRIFRQLFGPAGAVDFLKHDRPPLLLVACGKDPCVAPATIRRNHERYRASGARTDFVLFPELTHLSIAEPGCEELAAYSAAWADDRLAPARLVPWATMTA